MTPVESELRVPVFADVVDAAEKLRGHCYVTSVLEWHVLNERGGGHFLFNAEALQRTDSCKFRGAYTRAAAPARARRQ